MFGKAMSIPDAALDEWERLATSMGPGGLRSVDLLTERELPEMALRKRRLATAIVADFYGWSQAHQQERRFDQVHREGAVPEDIPEVSLPPEIVKDGRVWLPRLLVTLGLAGSNADARRKIAEGGVRLDGAPVTDPEAELAASDLVGRVIQTGRRRFVRVGA